MRETKWYVRDTMQTEDGYDFVFVVDVSETDCVANVYTDSPEAEERANLISAAPDLHEALDALCLQVPKIHGTKFPREDSMRTVQLLEDAHKALAKARGEQ